MILNINHNVVYLPRTEVFSLALAACLISVRNMKTMKNHVLVFVIPEYCTTMDKEKSHVPFLRWPLGCQYFHNDRV